MTQRRVRYAMATAWLAAMLELAGCLLVPGKFDAALDIRRDGSFTWHYSGEMVMVGLTALAAQADADKTRPFAPHPCWNQPIAKAASPVSVAPAVQPAAVPTLAPRDRDVGAPRLSHACAADELAEQRRIWETAQAERAARHRADAARLKALFGGIDPTDPQAAEEIAARLRQQAGWRSVSYQGGGVYLVDFVMSGRLDRDFQFPTVERLPLVTAFVALSRRADGTVRLDAPGLAGTISPALAALTRGAVDAGKATATSDPLANRVDGHLTLTTDAAVLANNTEAGAQLDAAGQRLEWQVNARTAAIPMAVLRLDR